MFIKMLENQRFNDNLLRTNHLDAYFKAKMANDKIDPKNISQELLDLLDQVIDSFK